MKSGAECREIVEIRLDGKDHCAAPVRISIAAPSAGLSDGSRDEQHTALFLRDREQTLVKLALEPDTYADDLDPP